MSDEQRPDSLGCYGSPWARTPVIDELARGGALFQEAYTPSPVCVPARSCLLTGRYGSGLGVLHNEQRLARDTAFLTWAFAAAGYRTASFGKKHYFVEGRQAFDVERGRATDSVVDATRYAAAYDMRDYDVVRYPGPQPWILGGRFPEAAERTAEAVNAGLALEWLASLGPADRFFLRVSFNAPHTPVVVPGPFAGAMDPASIRLPFCSPDEFRAMPPYLREALGSYQGSARLSREQLMQARRYYYERVAFLDAQVGRLLDGLRRRGRLENTIVAFVSDHGTHLGDHGLLQKQTFYEQVATVPYLFRYPGGIRPGSRFRTPVSTLTLLATLIELAGLPAPESVEAPSLAANLRGGVEPAAAPVFSEIKLGYRGYRDDDRLVMIRSGRHKMFLFQDPSGPERFRGREEGSLFDLATDPAEERDLFRNRRALAAGMQEQIRAWDARPRSRVTRP